MKSLFTLLTIAIGLNVSAQDLFIGPEIGLNFIQIEKQDIGNDYQGGLFVGAAVEYKFNKALSLRTGIYYSQGRQQTRDFDTTELNLSSSFLKSSCINSENCFFNVSNFSSHGQLVVVVVNQLIY